MAPAQSSVIARSEATKQSILSFLGGTDCFASLAMTVGASLGSLPDPKNLPRLRRTCDLSAGVARASSDALDQLPVRGHLGAVAEIESVLKPGAEMAAQISATLVQRPDFGAADRGDLPMRLPQFQLQQNRQQFRIGRHAGGDAHHEVILQRPLVHTGLAVHADATHDADVKTFEFGN